MAIITINGAQRDIERAAVDWLQRSCAGIEAVAEGDLVSISSDDLTSEELAAAWRTALLNETRHRQSAERRQQMLERLVR